jgi:Helicase associated domain
MDRLAELGVQFTAARRLPFDERAVKWLDFRTKHGRDPCHITEDGGLVQWIRKQRRRKKELDAGKKTVLTREQADRLTSWGFVWEGGEDTPATTTATEDGSSNNSSNNKARSTTKFRTPLINTAKRPWKERFALLVAFHKEHGHCLVPSTYPDLGPWVRSQRKQYKHLQDGKKSQLTPDRITKLEQIGFVFRARRQGDEIAVHIPSAKQGFNELEDADASGGAATSRRDEEAEEADNGEEEEEEDETSSEEEEGDPSRLPSPQQQPQRRKRQGVAAKAPRHQRERQPPQRQVLPPSVAGVPPAAHVVPYPYSNPWDQYDL